MDKIIFQYNNVDQPQLMIKSVKDDIVSFLGLLKFDKSGLNNNLPIYDEIVIAIDQFLTRRNIERNNALFIVNATENVKITTILPNISDRKVKKIYELELEHKIPNINDYDCLSVVSESKNNKIFYEYLVDSKYHDFFEEVGKALSFNNVEIDYMNSCLFEGLSSVIEEDTYAYIYEESKIAYLLVVINGELCGYSSFENKETNYRLNISSIVDKHIYELEKANINYLFTNREIPCLKGLNPIVKAFVLGGKLNG